MSLISSDFRETLRRFAIIEFFFFNVKFLVLFGVITSSSHSSRKCREAGILLALNDGEVNGDEADTGINGAAVAFGVEVSDFVFSVTTTEVASFDCGWRFSGIDGDTVGATGGSIDRRGRGGGAGGVL